MSDFMKGKKGIIMGVANDHSLAWGIAAKLASHGAEIGFTYQNEVLQTRVEKLAQTIGSDFLVPCDVRDNQSIAAVFEAAEKKWGKIDFVVHAIAFSDKEELRGEYTNTSRDNFIQSLDISCYSFTVVAKEAGKIMNEGGSMITLTYYGAEKVIPNYNVMGVAKAALESSVRYLAADFGPKQIRVNAISAGPVRTLAASAIGDIRNLLKIHQANTPLRRNTTLEDVGGASVFLLSDLGSGVTGEVLHVDSGYHIIGGTKNSTAED
jgi:enoyl-[acyl-carrier protein] reductase I